MIDEPFPDPGEFSDGVVLLRLRETTPADEARGRAPAYQFTILAVEVSRPVGLLSLRIGTSEWLERYAGHVGYAVDPGWRGRGFAARALALAAPLAWRHGIVPLWVTCNPDNVASRRTCERAGASYVDTVALPPGNDMYARGERLKCRYALVPGKGDGALVGRPGEERRGDGA